MRQNARVTRAGSRGRQPMPPGKFLDKNIFKIGVMRVFTKNKKQNIPLEQT